MTSPCCSCTGPKEASGSAGPAPSGLPLICLVPRDGATPSKGSYNVGKSHTTPAPTPSPGSSQGFQLLDEEYIKKHFKLPQRALYLDPFRRPLITFPMGQDQSKNFNMAKKDKINQMILDGLLDSSAAIKAPTTFPYAETEEETGKKTEDDEEIIYILQLPDYESTCPVHNQKIRTPRFIWHSVKKTKKGEEESKQGPGPMNKPKPWLLSRHTNFDVESRW